MKITSTLNDVNYGHSRIWKLMRDRNPELEMPCDFIPPTYRFEKLFSINLPNREEWISSSPIPSTNALPWYTDGSRSHLSGASYHCSQVQCNESLLLGKYASVFQAEITGISGSCYEITQKKHFTLPIYIFTDSQAAMKSINKNRFTSSLALECRDALDALSSQCQVTLVWVPGHSGIQGNEAADALARAASHTPLLGPEPGIPVSLSTLELCIKDWKLETFTSSWNSIGIARQSKNCISIRPACTKYFLSLKKKNLKRLTDILTGHCSLNNHLHVMGLNDSPYCDKCGDLESAEHFLCSCPAFIKARAKFLGSFIIQYDTIWSIHPKYILKYINGTNRY